MKVKCFLSNIIEKVEHTMFPHYVCPFCGDETPGGVVCADCNKSLIAPMFCEKCGEHVSEGSRVCIECKEIERLFDRNYSVYRYENHVAASIKRFKFNNAKYLATDFAKLLAKKFADVNIDVDIVTCVPSTKQRIKERGYNQAAEMAKGFANVVELPFVEALIKTKETPHQIELSKAERLKNLAGSFSVVDKWLIKGKNVLIIDDVFTTGSTMSACAKVLKKAGANKVYCLTLAKTALIN